MVDTTILEKLRQASQQQKKRRVDSVYGFSQQCVGDSQFIPSTQPCTVINATQTTRSRIHSQCDLSQTSLKQWTAAPQKTSTLTFDAYCQVSSLVAERRRPALAITQTSLTIPPAVITNDSVSIQCDCAPTNPGITQEDLENILELLLSPLHVKCDSILACVGNKNIPEPPALPRPPSSQELDDDEMVYLSFLFDHEKSTSVEIELVDAPPIIREVSLKSAVQDKQPLLKPKRARARKQPVQVHREETEILPNISTCLKRARFTVL